MTRLIYTLFILTLIPVNAMAIEINEQGAQKLKASIQELLNYQKTVNESFGSVRVIYGGELKVLQRSNYYTIAFPHILLKSTEEENKQSLDIGVITMNAIPGDEPGYWKTVIKFPTTITASDNSDDEDLIIHLGKQNTTAIFNDRLGYFTKFNATLSNLGFKSAGQDIGFGLGGLQFYINLNESKNKEGKFSGPGHVRLTNLTTKTPDNTGAGNTGSVKVGELKFNFALRDFKLPTLKDYKETLLKHADTFQSLNNLEQDGSEKLVNPKSVTDMLFDLYAYDMSGFSFQYNIKDIEINTPSKNTTNGLQSLKLGAASFGLDSQGLDTEKGTINIKAGYDTIKMYPIAPEQNDILPQHVDLNIKAQDIPYKTLTETIKATAQSAAQNPALASVAAQSLLIRLPALLSQSGTQIIIENSNVKNDLYAMTFNGKLMADLTAIMGFSAKFKAIFEGLDNLLVVSKARAQATDGTGSTKTAEEFAKIAKTLETLKSIGRNITGPNGKPGYSFELETTPQGQILVNDQDIRNISPTTSP